MKEIKIPAKIAELSRLTPNDKLLFGVIYSNMEDGVCVMSRAALATKICCTEQTVRNSLQNLSMAGLVMNDQKVRVEKGVAYALKVVM